MTDRAAPWLTDAECDAIYEQASHAAGYAAYPSRALIRAGYAAGQAHPQGQGINVPREVTCPHCGMPFEVES